MKYRQLTSDQRYTISTLRKEGYNPAGIARALGCHRSTITRELRRNSRLNGRTYVYWPSKAVQMTNGRRRRSRRNRQFSTAQWAIVIARLEQKWSPEQISATLRIEGILSISHETIYQYLWAEKANGGTLYKHLRQSSKRRRKRHNTYDSRGQLAGKRMIDERPAHVDSRRSSGHWEIDTVMGGRDTHCILTMVERKHGYVLIGKLRNRTTQEINQRMVTLMHGSGFEFKTITADNGTEFHGYQKIEQKTRVKFYFAHPYHSWERGSNENMNGLIRQYLPKRTSMAETTQRECTTIANELNIRPRKRYGFRTPEDMMYGY